MKKTYFKGLIIVLLIVIGQKTKANTFITSGGDSSRVKLALRQVNEAYGNAFIKGDSSIFLNCYAPDACILPANSSAICGEAGLLAFYKFGYKTGVRNIVFMSLGLYGLTDQYVTEQGNYEMFDGNNTSLGKGKFLVIWKKTSDGWRMYRDMFNSDAPPARSVKKMQ